LCNNLIFESEAKTINEKGSSKFKRSAVELCLEPMLKIELNTTRFLGLLAKLIGVTEKLQNSPPQLVPEEDLVGNFVLEGLLFDI